MGPDPKHSGAAGSSLHPDRRCDARLRGGDDSYASAYAGAGFEAVGRFRHRSFDMMIEQRKQTEFGPEGGFYMADNSDTARVSAVLDQFATALRNRDAAAGVALYADDAVDYDLAPPLRIDTRQGRDPAYIQEGFDTWASPIESQTHDVTRRA